MGHPYYDALQHADVNFDADEHRDADPNFYGNTGSNIDFDIDANCDGYEYQHSNDHTNLYGDKYGYSGKFRDTNFDDHIDQYGNSDRYGHADVLVGSLRPIDPAGNERHRLSGL